MYLFGGEVKGKEISLIFPNNLFPIKNNPVLYKEIDEVWLIEHPWYFGGDDIQVYFNKKKILMYRIAMKEYQKELNQAGYRTKYFDYANDFTGSLHSGCIVNYIDPVDFWMKQFLDKLKCGEIICHDNPGFFLIDEELDEWRKSKKFTFLSFYKKLRRKFDVLMTKKSKPKGDKWTYDTENRDKITDTKDIPVLPKFQHTNLAKEKAYVEKNFGDYYGNTNNFDWIPCTRTQARTMLRNFIKKRLTDFGQYQDSISGNWHNYHSLLSAAINMGLLLPNEVIDEIESAWRIPQNSREGFIRQILGWREYMRMVYVARGKKMRKKNYFRANRALGDQWYDGTTNIPLVDQTIKRAFDNGYLHHIERLMIMCNVMTLAGIHPDDVYQWFMEFSIDSYDWVMIGNVYDMGTWAAGGEITTKPYISSSAYAYRMGGPTDVTWDALFWNFVHKHKEKIKKIGRLKQLVNYYKKKSAHDKSKYKIVSKAFIKRTTTKYKN